MFEIVPIEGACEVGSLSLRIDTGLPLCNQTELTHFEIIHTGLAFKGFLILCGHLVRTQPLSLLSIFLRALLGKVVVVRVNGGKDK